LLWKENNFFMRYKVNLKKTEEEALENIKDAIQSYLETIEEFKKLL